MARFTALARPGIGLPIVANNAWDRVLTAGYPGTLADAGSYLLPDGGNGTFTFSGLFLQDGAVLTGAVSGISFDDPAAPDAGFAISGIAMRFERMVSLAEAGEAGRLHAKLWRGDDLLSGGASTADLNGYGGNDSIESGTGDSTLDGGSDNDTLDGGAGGDWLLGSDGWDSLSGGDGGDTLDGGDGSDTLTAGPGVDVLHGGAGADRFVFDVFDSVGTNPDYLSLDVVEDYDQVEGDVVDLGPLRAGREMIGWVGLLSYGDGGLVVGLAGTAGTPFGWILFKGLTGVQQITFAAGSWSDGGEMNLRGEFAFTNSGLFVPLGTMAGDSGNDTLVGGSGSDTIRGESGRDSIEGGDGDNSIEGGDGKDTLVGGSGSDNIRGEGGRDSIDGGDGYNSIEGGEGNDTLVAGNLGDTVNGGAGNDLLIDAGGLYAILRGDAGNDTISLGSDNRGVSFNVFILEGGDGNDSISSTNGPDRENIAGGAGNDTIQGGPGLDQLSGGAGADRFVYGAGDAASRGTAAFEVISDYNQAEGDVLDLSLIDADPIAAGDQAFHLGGEAGPDQVSSVLMDYFGQTALQLTFSLSIDGEGPPAERLFLIGVAAIDQVTLIL